jgi:sialate O-acetylesterase
MVLQQGMRVAIWGWAAEGEEVTVSFRGQKAKTKAQDGKWQVKLSRLKAGGPDALVIQGKNRIELKNVLVGDVWICSGQSNMEWPLDKAYQGSNAVASSANPMLRLFKVARARANAPLDDVKATWTESNPATTPAFSAVAYYFGRELQQARRVPVGLIETCWGGTPAEVWMSESVLASNADYKRDVLDAYAALHADPAKEAERTPRKPAELYNAMIAPLLPCAIKGAIWYQGESNAGRAAQYRALFADMIRNWRHDWNESDFPFLVVQLAPFDKGKKRELATITAKPEESDWAELREAQALATKLLPKVGMAVITDIGDKDNIHPARKEAVGVRLALAARGIAYGEKIEYSGPIYRTMKVKGDTAVLSFDHVGNGLESRNGELKGFAICGPDKKFVWATADIQGERVVVSSREITQPVAVRYGWADFPVVNFWNKADLPAAPFRTDNFPMITAQKK